MFSSASCWSSSRVAITGVRAQSPDQKPLAFEVASIKPTPADRAFLPGCETPNV
jgi:hypothetical protein